jgi:hypothetical protein
MIPGLILIRLGLVGRIPVLPRHAAGVCVDHHTPIAVPAMSDELSGFIACGVFLSHLEVF